MPHVNSNAVAALRGEVFTRAEALGHGVTRHALDAALQRGDCQRVFPRVYVGRERIDDPDARFEAALKYAGDGAYLGCISAAAAWRLPVPGVDDVHVGVPRRRRVESCAGLTVHHYDDPSPAEVIHRGDLAVVSRHLAVVQAFRCLNAEARAALIVGSVQQRLIVPDRVAAHIPSRMPGRRQLLEILELAAGGSHSTLEMRLLLTVIRRFGLPEPVRQHPVRLSRGRVFLDAAYPDHLVDVETDGKAWHFDPRRRTADVERDAELAGLGWVTLRFLHERVVENPAWVAERIETTLRSRGWPGHVHRSA